MKILISSSGFIDGQGYQRTFHIAEELVSFGHEVTYLTSQHKRYKFPFMINNRNGVKEVAVYDFMPKKIKKLGVSPIAVLFKTLHVLNKRYDILHADAGHRISSGFPCWIHRKIYGTKYITEWWDFQGRGGQFETKSFIWKYSYGLIDNHLEKSDKKKANGVVALSTFTKSRAIDIGVNEKDITIIYGGSDVNNIKYVPDNNEYRRLYGLDKADFVIVLVGVVTSDDFGPILDLLQQLNEKKISVKIVTTGKIIKGLDEFGEDTFKQLGFVDYAEYYKVLSVADIFYLYQAKNDIQKAKWPNKIGDYLAAGRIIIANPINDISVLQNENNIDSLLFIDYNFESLYSLLIDLFSKKDKLIEIGRKNRDVAYHISWSKRAKEFEEFYKRILNKNDYYRI
jgi:spore coat polysaccharide biosynthesis predicted glycosyltransferase SpsG